MKLKTVLYIAFIKKEEELIAGFAVGYRASVFVDKIFFHKFYVI
jgi:hypothetical protein